jgi:hypothetical protein
LATSLNNKISQSLAQSKAAKAAQAIKKTGAKALTSPQIIAQARAIQQQRALDQQAKDAQAQQAQQFAQRQALARQTAQQRTQAIKSRTPQFGTPGKVTMPATLPVQQPQQIQRAQEALQAVSQPVQQPTPAPAPVQQPQQIQRAQEVLQAMPPGDMFIGNIKRASFTPEQQAEIMLSMPPEQQALVKQQNPDQYSDFLIPSDMEARPIAVNGQPVLSPGKGQVGPAILVPDSQPTLSINQTGGVPGFNAPAPRPDFNTLSEQELRNIAYANNEDWGSLYNKLQASDIGQQYQKGYNDFLGLQRQYLDSTQSERPDIAQAQNTGNWDDYNSREGAYLRKVDQLVQQDPRFQTVKPYSQSHMFQDYLVNQTADNNPMLQQFQAANTYFKRFVEPNIVIGPAMTTSQQPTQGFASLASISSPQLGAGIYPTATPGIMPG